MMQAEAMKADLERRLARLEAATAPPKALPDVEIIYSTIVVDASLPLPEPPPSRPPFRYGSIKQVKVVFVEPLWPEGCFS